MKPIQQRWYQQRYEGSLRSAALRRRVKNITSAIQSTIGALYQQTSPQLLLPC
jgi:hypothetical protein